MKDLKVSTTGIRLILRFETWQHKAYDDGYGYWSIGVGHTGTKPKPGTIITSEQVWVLFVNDLAAVEECINDVVNVPLNANEFDALVSFVFNVGTTAFKKSTLLKKLNANDRSGAAKQFERWCMVKGKVSQGLLKRRKLERQLFEGIEPAIA